ncbi:Sua5/YciO/YrdC/YwlC family protein, partial [Roseateles sp. GG27B]
LQSAAAPIVLLNGLDDLNAVGAVVALSDLNQRAAVHLATDVAPGLRTLGFMLPNTPLHHLMLRRMNRPIVLTSGNLVDEPQAIDND